jgi:hypothetical protein
VLQRDVEAPAVSSAALREQVAAIEATLPALTDAAAAAGLASYGAPDNLALRHDADAAMAALQSANGELERLRLALPAAEQNEAADAETRATAERQRQKDRLIRDRDRLFTLADAEYTKYEVAVGELPDAEAKLADLEHQRQNQQVVVDVLIERRDNAVDHCCEYTEQVAALDAQIADFPVTAAEVDAKEAAERAAREAEAAERLRILEEQTDRELREIHAAAALAHDAELVPVTPFRMAPGGWPPGWKTEQRPKTDYPSRVEHWVLAVPRRDLDKIEV